MPQVVPDPNAPTILPPPKRVTFRATMKPQILYAGRTDEQIKFESPVKRVGGQFDGCTPNGWHVMLRRDDGELESLYGPVDNPNDACVALVKLINGEPV